MKALLVCLVCVLSAVSFCNAQEADAGPRLDVRALELKRNDLHLRIEKGDYTAFADAASLPTKTAISFLWWYANQSHPASNVARATLKQVPGYVEYFAKQFAEATRGGGVDEEGFMIISAIGTPPAAAVVAPYVFDFTTTPARGDILSSMNAVSAALALGRMKLSDAPTLRNPEFYKTDDLIAWQQWAVDRGLVPKEWSSKVGKGETIQQLRRLERAELMQQNAVSPNASTPPPAPGEAPPSVTPRSPAKPAVPALTPPKEPTTFPAWPWIAAAIAFVVVLALVIKRRA